jgi:hypothetical protein
MKKRTNQLIQIEINHIYIYIHCDAMRQLCSVLFTLDLTFIYMINQDRRQSVIFTLELFHSFVLVTMII